MIAMNMDELGTQHEEIALIAAHLRQAIADPDQPQAVSALRWQLARKLMAHLALEDRILYPALQRQGDDRVRTTAARIQAEIGALAESFARYMAAWTDERITRDWRGFCADSGRILDALARRIDREERVLYPLARSIDDQATGQIARAG
ncbi:hemerythrin domain-containing protein [Sphingobium yanoikuyae]|uniref:Hemerythrin domain-containing protein n=1 Tax=Sphingobium yanoikuyae TaxID=13690 RepID=A0A6M4G2I0_SPHYA|nr:hemerythrin domain-containing protein [Sphingobium yanoikuyae]QJR00774.1 hemerythrin domain-containing protein [Sphingobium yanoikuyae]